MISCSKETRIIASICHKEQVYLFCGPQELMQWPNAKAAGKFFKRFYGIIFRSGDKGLKTFHLLADFRLHEVALSAIADDSFERAVVKAEADRERVFAPHEYSIVPLTVEGVTMQTLPCYGVKAESWHVAGVRPPFPKEISKG